METKEELLKHITTRLMRIINIQNRIEEFPVLLEEGVEVTPTESHTIQAIGENESFNITDLSVHFGVTKSAASQITARLSQKGYVKKTVSETSNKELKLELTELGRKAFAAHERCHSTHLATIIDRLGSFSLSQIATASVFLEVIEDVMKERLKNR